MLSPLPPFPAMNRVTEVVEICLNMSSQSSVNLVIVVLNEKPITDILNIPLTIEALLPPSGIQCGVKELLSNRERNVQL